jgi:hypothetical protein
VGCWQHCIRGSALGRQTSQAVKCFFMGFLVFVIVFGLLWSSDVLAQDGQVLRMNPFDARSPWKDLTPQFFVHDSLTAPVHGAEYRFNAPEFRQFGTNGGSIGLRSLKTDRLRISTSGEARELGSRGPFRATLFALAQGDTPAASSSQAASPTSGGSTPRVKKKSSKWIWIAVAAGGAAAALALTMKKSSATSDTESVSMTPTVPTITLGTPTVGAQ